MAPVHGAVASAADLMPFGHLGWGFCDRTEFLTRAGEYLADGLDCHQRVEYVGDNSREALRAELAAMPKIADRAHAGDIAVTPAREFYAMPAGRDVVNPHLAMANWMATIQTALDNGHTGHRTVVDATGMARTPEQRAALARFEFLSDKQAATAHPVSALCGYDLNQLGTHANELICLHPYISQRAPRFQLYAQPHECVLTGDVDAATDDLFTATLDHIAPLTTNIISIDAQHLEFIGHRQLLELNQHAHRHHQQVILRAPQPITIRLVDLIKPTNVAIQPPPTPR